MLLVLGKAVWTPVELDVGSSLSVDSMNLQTGLAAEAITRYGQSILSFDRWTALEEESTIEVTLEITVLIASELTANLAEHWWLGSNPSSAWNRLPDWNVRDSCLDYVVLDILHINLLAARKIAHSKSSSSYNL